MTWENTAENILKSKSFVDDFELSFHESNFIIPFPGLLKVSLNLLEQSINSNSKRLIMVYPEAKYLPSLTVVFQAISFITNKKFHSEYDPHTFLEGQKLKTNNKICVFDSIKTGNDGIERIWVKFGNGDIRAYPLENAPDFQLIDTKRRLSKDPVIRIKKPCEKQLFDLLVSNKGFITENIIYVASARQFLNTFTEVELLSKKLIDLILMGVVNQGNKIDILNRGQIKGNATLVFADSLYSADNILSENTKCVFIDNHSENLLNNQLDAVDKILGKNIPVIIMSDSVHSFNFETLNDRGFSVFRWNKSSILPEMLNILPKNVIDRKIINSYKNNIIYDDCDNDEFVEIFNNFRKIKRCLEDSSQIINDIYFQLYKISITLLRNVIKLSVTEQNNKLLELVHIENNLKTQTRNISSDYMESFFNVIDNLKTILGDNYFYEKPNCVENIIKKSMFNNIIIVISDKEDKSYYNIYWDSFLKNCELDKNISIMSYQEYCNSAFSIETQVIACGWLGKNKMRNILYCNNATELHVLLNRIERRWKRAHLRDMSEELKIEFSLLPEIKKLVFEDEYPEIISEDERNSVIDDIDLLEDAIQVNQFRKYYAGENHADSNMVVEAIPVTFVRDYFTFYRASSQIIIATKIINGINTDLTENIKKKTTDLEIGDYVVIRETERSLIRDFADEILKEEGKADYREKANKWKDGLNERRRHSPIIDIYNKVKQDGLEISYPAFRNWMENDDFIAPEDKDNLLYIAVALNDTYLIDNIDPIYEICKYVRRKHVEAGQRLSKKLKDEIVKIISGIPKNKRTDIWDPIELTLDKIGKIKILKVTNIGKRMPVEIGHTNRLLHELSTVRYSIEGRKIWEVFQDYALDRKACRELGFIPDENKIYRKVG